MKRILLIIGLVLAVSIPFTVFAATSDTEAAKAIREFCGMGVSENCSTGDCETGTSENCSAGGCETGTSENRSVGGCETEGFSGHGACSDCSSGCSETSN